MPKSKPGRGSDQFPLRLPDGMRERIKMQAKYHGRSMNEEIVRILFQEYPDKMDDFERAVALLEISVARYSANDDEALKSEFRKQIARKAKAIIHAVESMDGK